MKISHAALCMGALAALCAACSPASEYFGNTVPPAEANAPPVGITLVFDNPLFDGMAGRHDKCLYFDGVQNHAVQMDVRIYAVDPSNGRVSNLYPIQSFVNGKDFFSGDPGGIRVNVPKSGGFFMEVTIYGEKDPDCCPGPPVGRPVFKASWPYGEYGGFNTRANLPKQVECLPF